MLPVSYELCQTKTTHFLIFFRAARELGGATIRTRWLIDSPDNKSQRYPHPWITGAASPPRAANRTFCLLEARRAPRGTDSHGCEVRRDRSINRANETLSVTGRRVSRRMTAATRFRIQLQSPLRWEDWMGCSCSIRWLGPVIVDIRIRYVGAGQRGDYAVWRSSSCW
jgi:hypothetical protein